MSQLNEIATRLNEKPKQLLTNGDAEKRDNHSWRIDMQDITNLQPVGEGAWGKVLSESENFFYLTLGLQSQMAWAGSGEKTKVRESDPGPNQRIPTRSQHATKVPP